MWLLRNLIIFLDRGVNFIARQVHFLMAARSCYRSVVTEGELREDGGPLVDHGVIYLNRVVLNPFIFNSSITGKLVKVGTLIEVSFGRVFNILNGEFDIVNF